VLKVYSPRANNFDDEDIETLGLLSDVIAAQMAHAKSFERQKHASNHDPLTGIQNRRAYEKRLVIECERARRHDDLLSLCIFDLDGFKGVNDRDGHPAGDVVLRRVAAILDDSRLSDEAFRIGGDEFAVLMPRTALADAHRAAERLADRVAAERLGSGAITVSYGVAETKGDAMAVHADADAALLAAKQRRPAGQRTAAR
jgi:diguanylate cyclase (GGDEF)-like protein